MPFGVELPENLGQPAPEAPVTESAPEGAEPKDSAPEGAKELSTSQEPNTPKETLDIDKLESFRFAGRDWTPKDLKNAYLMREDYTRKTQEVAEARKYADNFSVDLQTVIQNPDLIAKLRAVYPKAYVDVAERVLAYRAQQQGTQQVTPNQNANDPLHKITQWQQQVDNKLSKIDQWEAHQQQVEIKGIESWLTSQYETLSKKYPLANGEVITARAQVLSDSGNEITEKVLDRLFKQNDEETKAHYEKVYKEKVTKQLEAGSKSKDVGAGGGVPGNAPKGLKTFKEAREAMIKDLGAR